MEQGRVWLAVFLSLALFFTYDYLVIRPYREAAKQRATTSTVPQTGASGEDRANQLPPIESPAKTPGAAPASVPIVPAGTPITVDTDLYRATFDSMGGRLRTFELKRYRQHIQDDGLGLVLIDGEHLPVLPLTIDVSGEGSDLTTKYTSNKTSLQLAQGESGTIELDGTLSNGAPIHKTLSFKGGDYVFAVVARIGGERSPDSVGLLMTPILDDSPKISRGGRAIGAEKAIALANGKLVDKPMKDVESAPTTVEGALWAGYASRYFVSLIVSEGESISATMGPAGSVPVVRVEEAAKDGSASFKVLIGPKEKEVLDAAGDQLGRALDFGWFWFIAVPLLYLLRAFYGVFGNYGVSIIVLTVLVKLATIPLTRAQYRSMQKMQQIQPDLERLKERYKDDASGMQREMMELYRKHGVNPFSGCVPMFLQIPIFVGLYNALMNAIELRHAPFLWWINDLSAPDRLMVGGVGIPVMVILMGASMLAQQWMTPAQGDPTQKRMMMFMPIIFTAMFLNFPSGLVLYWLVNNVISVIQQYVVLRGAKQGAHA